MVGMILGNRYEIIKEIGSGGMANVYLGYCKVLNRDVAVKILKSEFATDKEFLTRFNKEAQAAASINSPNIVNVYDVGHDGDTHYIVMEYVEGQTLKEYIDKNGMLSWQQTIEYAIQICYALDKAHKLGIVHRDIKPQNIILTDDGVLKVTDFGIARASTNETVNTTESTMGSVHYFSPEQARGGFTDAKSDIYSLGVVMYELITGKLPFNGDTPIAIAIKHIQEKPVSPKEYNISIPLAVEAIILKAMSKEQTARYQSATEMLADLNAAIKQPDVVNEHVEINIPTDTIKIEPVKDEVTEEPEKSNYHRTVADNSKKKPAKKTKTAKTVDQGSAKKAVALAFVTAFVILGMVVLLGFSMLGGCGREYDVPDLVGKMYDDVIEDKEYKKYTITIEQYIDSHEYEPGYIISQTPKGGTTTKNLKEIKIKVARDSDSFILGDFKGKSLADLKKDLSKEIKTYAIQIAEQEEESPDVEKDKISRTYPPAGSEVKRGTTITVYISKGGLSMPDLTGFTLASAKEVLLKYELELGDITPSNATDSYVVIGQSKDPEETVAKGELIDLELRENHDSPTVNPDQGGEEGGANSKTITIVIPQSKDMTNVRILQDGRVIHNQTHSKTEGSFDVTLKGNGQSKVDIYFDGNFNSSIMVTL